MITFKEVYSLPFKKYSLHDTWVYDQRDNFCFQFENYRDNINELLLNVINNEENLTNKELSFTHHNGEIKDNKGIHLITIRGWGNLTSPNCLGLSSEEAANVQDTLAEFIINRLNYSYENTTRD